VDTFFVLPALEESFYKRFRGDYLPLPRVSETCLPSNDASALHFVYPFENASVFLPLESNGDRRPLLARAATRGDQERLYWYLDDQFLGITLDAHQIACLPPPGRHQLTVVQEGGQRISTDFQVSWD
jgi:penicillin-binding protein 1C